MSLRLPSQASVGPESKDPPSTSGFRSKSSPYIVVPTTLPAAASDLVISPRPETKAVQQPDWNTPPGPVKADNATLPSPNGPTQPDTGPPVLDPSGNQTRLTKGEELDLTEVICMNLIATGSFGTVYYGRYRDKEVAVKLLNPPPEISDDKMEKLAKSFHSEVGVWQELSHPNIVQFYGASAGTMKQGVKGADGQRPGMPVWAIVTEYLSGGTVKGLLKKQRRHPWKTVVKLARGVASGLAYLHSQDIVHRDIKSDNLLLDSDKTVKIADFGVARIEAANPVDMTSATGTVRWMAPEIIDNQPYTRKVDVYSFSIVLWELCTGDHPYRELTMLQLAYQVVNKGLRPRIPEYCPRELAALMRRCWDQDAAKRPEFSDIVEELDRIAERLAEEKDERPALQRLFSGCFGGGSK